MTNNMFAFQTFYDRQYANDERSRLRVSLAQNTRQCHDRHGKLTRSRAEFAAMAGEVARVPIMSLPYVRPIGAMSDGAVLDLVGQAGLLCVRPDVRTAPLTAGDPFAGNRFAPSCADLGVLFGDAGAVLEASRTPVSARVVSARAQRSHRHG